ncbi:MAG: ParB/RepB/Spo0J family partition protein [Spirochaetes bacterium]|nr:ParB/RepB/Spo0J family partition protein [Spirochaetota bacterium]
MPQLRKVLGKGLDALLGDPKIGSLEIQQIDIDKIIPNPFQPRTRFSGLEELSLSIKVKGVLIPITVTRSNDKFELVHGERRWRAARMAGLDKIPAIIRQFENNEKLEIALIENIQRENLDPVDEAKAYRLLIDKFKISQEEVARRVGKNRSTITNSLRLLSLPNKVLIDLKEGRLQVGHVRPLINIKNPNVIEQLRNKIINENLSSRQAEEAVKKYKPDYKPPKRKKDKRNAELMNLEDNLQEKMGTKVRIQGDQNKGRILIEYYSSEDLERILEILK